MSTCDALRAIHTLSTYVALSAISSLNAIHALSTCDALSTCGALRTCNTAHKSHDQLLIIYKTSGSSATRTDQGHWQYPIVIGHFTGCAVYLPFLEVVAVVTILDGDYLGCLNQSQENVNILTTVRDVIDKNVRSRCLRDLIPQHISCTRITTLSCGVGLVIEQVTADARIALVALHTLRTF